MAWTTRGTTNYFDAPTVAGTRYYYEVQAVNSAEHPRRPTWRVHLSPGLFRESVACQRSKRPRLLDDDDERRLFNFGNAGFYGSPGPADQPYVSLASTSDGRGYWVVAADGTVYVFGDARY